MSGVHEVVYLNNIEALKSALRRGVDVNARDKSNATALMLAGWRGHEECARILIAHGAQVNLQDENGDSAMTWAITRGHAGMVRLLINNGADLDQKNKAGQTLLDIAKEKAKAEIVQILQEAPEKRRQAQQAIIKAKQKRLNDLARKRRGGPS